MKKLLLSLSISAFALSLQAAPVNIGETYVISTPNNAMDINFNGGGTVGADGRVTSYVSTTSEDRFLGKGTNGDWDATITVGSNVNAIMNFSTTKVEGYDNFDASTVNNQYHVGGSNVSSNIASIFLQGDSASSSSFAFYGTNFMTGGGFKSSVDSEKSSCEDTLEISDVAFSFNGTGSFGSNINTFRNATIDLNSGTLFAGQKWIKQSGGKVLVDIVQSTTLDNATFNINSSKTISGISEGTPVTTAGGPFGKGKNGTVGDLGVLTLENSSNLNVNKGIVNANTFTADSTSFINVKNGAKFVVVNEMALNKTNLAQIKVDTGGTLEALNSSINLVNNEDFSISGGNYNFGKFAGTTNGQSKVYITADSFRISDMAGGASSMRTFFIGMDADGNTHETVYTTSAGFQLNGGGILVLRGGSSINSAGNSLNLSDTTAYDSSKAWGHANYIEAGTVLTSAHSRINGGFFDGKITVSNGYQPNSNWDYTFALGIVSQKANIVLGSNADITVYGNTTNSEAKGLQGKLFSMVGNVTVNAGLGKIRADDVAGMYIRKPDDNSSTVLTLNSTDAFAIGYSDATNKVFNTQAQSKFLLEAGVKAKFVINADNNIGTVAFGDNTSNLILDIAQGKKLTVGSFENLGSGKMSIGLDSEVLYGEFVVKMDADVISDKISFYEVGADGNMTAIERTVANGTLFVDEISSGMFTVYTQVPEPATVAAILGALALGFAIYRRRR